MTNVHEGDYRIGGRAQVTAPGHLDESVFAAALSNGRTLLEEHVIGRDDPPLTWYVDAEHVWFDAA